ncbi:MAG: peroxiredoxin [Oligoflexia bacterium]|nr:peroxiredoxin [Oligoflexia bacterium]
MAKQLIIALFLSTLSVNCLAIELKTDDLAPLFKTKTHEGNNFDLASRKGKWTVLYFYPKAETPGCTKQACAFRDAIKSIRALDADVFGISADEVSELSKFHKKHNLNFTLLADPKVEIINAYGAKMPVIDMSKRWTFIIDPSLKIRTINNKVDPIKDADEVAKKIKTLKGA